MTEPKYYITGAEALRALADGKRVRRANWKQGEYVQLSQGMVVDNDESGWTDFGDGNGPWEIVEEPATDAELVAEMRRLAQSIEDDKTVANAAGVARRCANMLEQRSTKP